MVEQNLTDFEQEIEKHELDRDLPDIVWNKYLKLKYKDKYKFKEGQEGIWNIKCKWGIIQPYSLKKGFLLYAGSFPSPNKKTFFLKKVPVYCEIIQDGEEEVTLKFKEEFLSRLVNVLEIRKKRKMSEKQRITCIKRLEEYRLRKKGVNDG